MDENARLEEIKLRVERNEYLANAAADLRFLLERVEHLRKKNEILSTQNLELMQEMENVKADYGDMR